MQYLYLPKKHWLKHDYLLYVYDVIADMARQADRRNLSSFTLNFKNEEIADSFESAEDMFEWMDNNGYHDTSKQMFQSHVFFSLLSDFCYYIYESLSCAERGKVTVAYSLLRKPIRDNLLYLEWLLSNSEEFYHIFMQGTVDQCDVANFKVFTKSRIQGIVRDAGQNSYMGEHLNYNNFIYTLRFDNKEEIGLQRIWNQSMHLVTTSPNYPTDKGNLNFVFADKEIWNEYWDYYYIVMPQLLAYALEICEALFIKMTSVNEVELALNRTIRMAKYGQILPHLTVVDELKNYQDEILSIISGSQIAPCLSCEHCDQPIVLNDKIIKEMIKQWTITCSNCEEEYSICRYYTEMEFITRK
ncbi:hypothetical protein EV294_102675 [Paenibacillus sp. BK033]|uniref:hypothetical protein n=1 Tax=Paenibacillus sp. BK033 TaxID=2512133 RepID=UPI00105356B1|nr:hypothetical protein [Paenibacillus sp. BK033]TCM99379.1 hypothetical protein EV294_102675 [Paenibacillus sp. BK033]